MDEEKLMKRLFRAVPDLPKGLEEQLRRHELSGVRYLFTFRSNGERHGYCTECKKIVSLKMKRTETPEEAQNRRKKHGDLGFCPECKSKVTFKDSGRGTAKLWDYAHFILAQKAGKMLVLRFFDVTRSFCDFSLEKSTGEVCDPGELKFHEEHRLFLDPVNRKAYQFTKQWEYFGNWYYTKFYGYKPGNACVKSDWKKRKNIRTNFAKYGFCTIYGLDEKLLKKTGFEYCPIGIYENTAGSYKNIVKFLYEYTLHPQAVEYMMKCGFPELLCSLIKHRALFLLNLRAKTPEKLLRLPKSEIKKLRNGVYKNPEYLENLSLEYVQVLQHYNLSDSEKLKFYQTVSLYSFKNIWEKILTYTTVTKAENYIKKHKKGELLPTREYADYIASCEHLGMDLTRHEILFPADFQAAHDRADALIRAQQARAREEATRAAREKRVADEKDIDLKIRKQYQALSKKWEFRSNGFLIRPAQNLEEIIREGDMQQICVGSTAQMYTTRHAQGTAFIFFIRSESEPDTPVCTVEITNEGTIVQCRGYQNHAPSEQVTAFLGQFKKHIAR